MRKGAFVPGAMLAACSMFANAQAAVHVEPSRLDGPRELAEQTEQGVIRDYLSAWKTMQAALDQNEPGMLSEDFVGTAKSRLTDTIQQQATAGIRTRYQDRAHNVQIVFYSPEGLSVELTDTVDYDVAVTDHNKQIATRKAHARFIVVMTPTEVRWKVRVFQEQSE